MFKSDSKTALQEIGPRFTLKLHSLKESLPKGAGVWDGKYTEEYAELESDELEVLQRQDGQDGQGGQDEDGQMAASAALDEQIVALGSESTKMRPNTGADASSSTGNKKRQRGEEETVGLDFQWKPKMSVSRRNFYL